MGRRIEQVFRTAHDMQGDAKTMERNLKLVAEQVLRQTMGTGTRRTMVKTWVQVLQQGSEGGLRPLTAGQVDQLMEGARQESEATEKTQESQGE